MKLTASILILIMSFVIGCSDSKDFIGVWQGEGKYSADWIEIIAQEKMYAVKYHYPNKMTLIGPPTDRVDTFSGKLVDDGIEVSTLFDTKTSIGYSKKEDKLLTANFVRNAVVEFQRSDQGALDKYLAKIEEERTKAKLQKNINKPHVSLPNLN